MATDFYRATCMHSADYMPWQDVCLSICLSHAGIESKRLQASTQCSKFLHHWVASPTILVFPYQTGCQYSDGDPPNGGVDCKGAMEKTRFTMESEQETTPKLSNGTSLNDREKPLTQISRSRYYSKSNNSKTVQARPIKSRVIYQSAPFSMTLNDPYPQFQGQAVF